MRRAFESAFFIALGRHDAHRIPMRITMIIASLGGGGAERTLAMLAEAWAARGDQVTVITLSGQDTDFYTLSTGVDRIALGILKAETGTTKLLSQISRFRQYLGRFRKLRQAIRRSEPQIVLSFMDITNILTLLCTRGLSVSVFVSEQVDPATVEIGRIANAFRRVTYRWAAGVVVLSDRQRSWAEQLATPGRAYVVPNPILVPASAANHLSKATGTVKLLAAMGRLTYQKGFDLLIPVFAHLAPDFPDWNLVILGEGPDRKALESLIQKYGLDDRVVLPGTVNPPSSVLLSADLFVFSSRFEGFGLALGEAMACGVPVVSFDCPTGPADLVRHEVDGLLVPPEDTNALEQALRRLMNNPEDRLQFGEHAARIGDRYGIDKILTIWDSIFSRALSQ